MIAAIPHSRPWITEADIRAVDDVLRSGTLVAGPEVRALENEVGAFFGLGPGVACASGSAAMSLALAALNLRNGDEVILPTYVCRNVLESVLNAGATPKLCDVDEAGVPTVRSVSARLTHRTRAILAVHIFGHWCDVASLAEIGLPVIEDACQAFGAAANHTRVGAHGTLSVLSFHATKCLTTGEGGMVIGRDASLLRTARELARSPALGSTLPAARMCDMQAALGRSQLRRYPAFLQRRARIREIFDATVRDLPISRGCLTGQFLFRYTLKTQRDFGQTQSEFAKHKVLIRRGVDDLLHRILGLADAEFPVATGLFEQNISIPFHPSLTDEEVSIVTRALEQVLG